jgi:hypothetical protein
MKSIHLTFLTATTLGILLAFSCTKSDQKEVIQDPKKDNIEEEKLFAPDLNIQNPLKPIVFEYTSTGCPGCGSWGKPTFKQIVEENKNNVEALAIHIKYGDPMITTHSTAIAANRYGQIYTPQIWVNDSNGVVLSGGSINGDASLERLNSLIAFQTQNPSDILADITFDKGENKVAVRYGIKSGLNSQNIFVACYLVENDVVATQSAYANNPAKHPFVIRSAIGETFGVNTLLYGDNKIIYEVKSEFELKTTNGKYGVTLVVWEKINNRYKPIGAYSVTL